MKGGNNQVPTWVVIASFSVVALVLVAVAWRQFWQPPVTVPLEKNGGDQQAWFETMRRLKAGE